jgi:ABC-type polysaccharide/polyol phosphate transport system ATPase subunit
MDRPIALGVEDGPAVEAIGLGKRFRALRSVQFAPATPIFRRFFERAGAVASGIDDYGDAADDDVDEDEGDDEGERGDGHDVGETRTDADGLVWALRDVSFTVAPGASLGVLGGPGSGKTTLIRILAGLTRPTEGRAVLRGVVAPTPQALAAFMRPELTARQNLRLAPRLVGLSRSALQGRAEAIVGFAGLEGIQLHSAGDPNGRLRRLAVSVVLNADVDILLFDDLPKLGDATFEGRVLEKLEERVNDGATLILASSGRDLIEQLCTHVLVLDGGRATATGDRASVFSPARSAVSPALIERRADSAVEGIEDRFAVDGGSHDWSPVGFNRWVAILGADAGVSEAGVIVRIALEIAAPQILVRVTVSFDDQSGHVTVLEQPEAIGYPERGIHTLLLEIPRRAILPGLYAGAVSARVTMKGRTFGIERQDAFTIDVSREMGSETHAGREAVVRWQIEARAPER